MKHRVSRLYFTFQIHNTNLKVVSKIILEYYLEDLGTRNTKDLFVNLAHHVQHRVDELGALGVVAL